jgi:N-acylneuraminate cytidylyltransferase
MVVISKERNPVTTARCTKLGLEVLQGVDDEVPAMTVWLAERNLDLTNTIYVGNGAGRFLADTILDRLGSAH